MTIDERLQTVAETRKLFREFYAHRNPKELVHDPAIEAGLDRIARLATTLSEDAFHVEMQRLIATLGDRHCRYVRSSHASTVAFLPFSVVRCVHSAGDIFLLSVVDDEGRAIGLKPGVQVTHWNGVPIEREIARFGWELPAANESAKVAQAVRYLTIRPLGFFPAPLEDWVTLSFTEDGAPEHVECRWKLREDPASVLLGRQLGHPPTDIRTVLLSASDPVLLSIINAEALSSGAVGELSARTIEYQGKSFGYIRIASFAPADAGAFFKRFIELLRIAPPNGLMIDLRGNPGGFAPLGEALVQTLVPGEVVASRFHFPITNGTVALCQSGLLFQAWSRSLSELLQTGAPYSQGFPIEGTDSDYNRHGQEYFGPVAVIVDGLTYSTAELFSAGLQDQNKSVTVVGTDKTTGAGGGNGWPHWVLRLFHPGFTVSPQHADALSAGTVPADLKSEFLGHRVRLSANVSVNASQDQFGLKWIMSDFPATYVLRLMPWFSERIGVYFAGDDALVDNLSDEISLELPVRRSTRVGPRTGIALEDIGVIADMHISLTRRDVLEQDADLLDAVCLALSAKEPRSFQLNVEQATGGGWKLTCSVDGIDRIDFYQGTRALSSNEVSESSVTVEIPNSIPSLIAKAYSGDDLVGLRRVQFT